MLPLPGVAVQYPQNEIGMIYRQMLSHDGIEPLEPAIERSASRRDDDNWMLLQAGRSPPLSIALDRSPPPALHRPLSTYLSTHPPC